MKFISIKCSITEFITRWSPKVVICKDKAFTCRDNQTCCQLPNNVGYGCCPKPNAVCCPDGKIIRNIFYHTQIFYSNYQRNPVFLWYILFFSGWHCCPQNFICDVDHGVCKSIPQNPPKSAANEYSNLIKFLLSKLQNILR